MYPLDPICQFIRWILSANVSVGSYLPVPAARSDEATG
jgi:hypothetical protein